MTDDAVPNVEFERRDVPPLLPLWLGGGLAGCVVVVLTCISLFYPAATAQEPRGRLHRLPPAPRLQVSPAADLATYDKRKAQELQTAPTPIDQAMQMTAQQGWGPPR